MKLSRSFAAILCALALGACSSSDTPEKKPETPAQREARIDKAIADDGKDPWAYYERGALEEEKGDLHRALDDYGAAVSLLPARHATRPPLALGRVHWKLGHAEPARRILEEVVTTVPEDPKLHVENRDFHDAALLLREIYAQEKDARASEKLRQRFLDEFGGKPEEWPAPANGG